MTNSEKQTWKELFLKAVAKMPDDMTISLSGGMDSSVILYGLLSLGKKPEYCITFKVGNEESKDLYFFRKICNEYNIRQIITQIPILDRKDLVEKCKDVIKHTHVGRTIDTEVCMAYDYMLKDMKTKNICLGIFEDAQYLSGAKPDINYHRFRNGKITETEYRNNYNKMRTFYLNHTKGNYYVIMKYINDRGFDVHTPLKDKELFEYSLNFAYHDWHRINNKTWFKYPLTEMFPEYFDKIGNGRHKKQFHIECGMKKYHTEVLLPGTGYKNLNGVYGKMKREIDNESKYTM